MEAPSSALIPQIVLDKLVHAAGRRSFARIYNSELADKSRSGLNGEFSTYQLVLQREKVNDSPAIGIKATDDSTFKLKIRGDYDEQDVHVVQKLEEILTRTTGAYIQIDGLLTPRQQHARFTQTQSLRYSI